MATKEEIIRGVELLIQEGQRAAKALTPEDWARTQDMGGWKNNEVLAHVASVGGLVAPMVQGMTNAPAGSDAGASVDIDALNAAMVGQRKDKSVAELADEIADAYTKVIEFVRAAPDDTLAKTASFRGYVDVPVSDLMMRMVVLHGLAHLYSAYSAVFDRK
ncbi:MAG: maleylpyruvate isomerase N-terminal domain-containing protein [Dehalococcoidia bacterium]